MQKHKAKKLQEEEDKQKGIKKVTIKPKKRGREKNSDQKGKKRRRSRRERMNKATEEEDNPFGPNIVIEKDNINNDNPQKDNKSSQRTRSRASSLSLSAIFDTDVGKLKIGDEQNRDDVAEFDLNISFSGGYVPNTDLSRVDKGQGNPQMSL